MTDQNPSNEEQAEHPGLLPDATPGLPMCADHIDPGTGARWFWWLIGVATFVAALAWVWSVHGAMTRLEGRLSAPAFRQDFGGRTEQRQQILSFETRLARIVGTSVESKLRALERSVERGPLSTEELRLLESTANELRLLQSNPAVAAGLAGEAKDHPRYQAAEPKVQMPSELQETLSDIAELRKIYYSALICFAFVGLLAAGLWYRQRCRYRLARMTPRHQLAVMKHYQEDRGR